MIYYPTSPTTKVSLKPTSFPKDTVFVKILDTIDKNLKSK